MQIYIFLLNVHVHMKLENNAGLVYFHKVTHSMIHLDPSVVPF